MVLPSLLFARTLCEINVLGEVLGLRRAASVDLDVVFDLVVAIDLVVGKEEILVASRLVLVRFDLDFAILAVANFVLAANFVAVANDAAVDVDVGVEDLLFSFALVAPVAFRAVFFRDLRRSSGFGFPLLLRSLRDDDASGKELSLACRG